MWFKERRERLTASQFGKVCKRKKRSNYLIFKDIFPVSNESFTSSATTYGKADEKAARKKI